VLSSYLCMKSANYILSDTLTEVCLFTELVHVDSNLCAKPRYHPQELWFLSITSAFSNA